MTRSRASRAAVTTAVLAVVLASGCEVGPDYVRPDVPVPAGWMEAAAESRPESRPARSAAWWRELGDPTLDALVAEALAGSFDLRIVAARVDEACAQRGVARSRQYPGVDVTASVVRQQDSGNSLFFTEPIRSTQYRTGFEATWELDLWGRVRREVEAAQADLDAAREMLADTVRVVVAEVAAEYVDLRGAERELLVLRSNVESQRETLGLTERLAAEGLGNDADVARARGFMRETEAAIPLLEARVAAGAHRLALLTGGDAGQIKEQLATPSALPTAPPDPALGVPWDVVQGRPDIRVAERDLAAATARIGVFVGDLFPRVTLFGRYGLDSTEAGSVFATDSISYGLGPSLRWPLFDFGLVRCRIQAQGARQRAALARYEQVVAQALTEVESSIASLIARRRSRDILADSVRQNREALRLVDARFREGATSFLDVLDAQRRMLLVEAALVRSETLLLLEYVVLSRALGMPDPGYQAAPAWCEPAP